MLTLRKVLKLDMVHHPSAPHGTFGVNLFLECGHVKRMKWSKWTGGRVVCHDCAALPELSRWPNRRAHPDAC